MQLHLVVVAKRTNESAGGNDVAAWGLRLSLRRCRCDPHRARCVGVLRQETIGDQRLQERRVGGGPAPWRRIGKLCHHFNERGRGWKGSNKGKGALTSFLPLASWLWALMQGRRRKQGRQRVWQGKPNRSPPPLFLSLRRSNSPQRPRISRIECSRFRSR